ncbi:MAG: hypothetical protein C4327_07020 [Meiothermus sp.]
MNEPKITPLARRLAEENGINWRALKGSGPEGTVVERDILSFLAKVMAGEIDLPPAPEEKSAPPEALPDIRQAQAMLAKEGVSLSDVIPASEPMPLTPPEPALPHPAEPMAAPGMAEAPVEPRHSADKHPTLGDFEINFDDLGLDSPEPARFALDSEPMPAEPAPSPEATLTWPEAQVPPAVAEALRSEPAPLDLGDWGEPAPAEPPLEPTPAVALEEASPPAWDQPEPAWSEPTPSWPEPSLEPTDATWPAEATPPAWPAPAFEAPLHEAAAEPVPSFTEMPEAPAPTLAASAPPVPEVAAATWSGLAADSSLPSHEAPAAVAPLRVQAWQRLVQVGPATQAAETLAQAWQREVGMLPLLYRAAERALVDLGLPLRANKGVLEGEVLKSYRATPAHTLRGTLEALEAAEEAGDGLVVLALEGFDQLIFPGAKVLSLGRSLGEQALLSVSGDLDPQTAGQLLERVAYYLERPILLA